MALDGIYTLALKEELKDALFEARIDKIYQPSKDDVVFTWRHRGGNGSASNKKSGIEEIKEKFKITSGGVKTLFSASANSPRVHITTQNLENPATAPMFCMILRKHLSGARLIDIKQDGLERALGFEFSAINEMGDIVTLTLVIEIMGRHSNIILLNADGKVIDSIKRVPPDKSSVRPILPGIIYAAPPQRGLKVDFSKSSAEDIVKKVCTQSDNVPNSLLNSYLGLSPLICREITHLAFGEMGVDLAGNALDENNQKKLVAVIEKVKDRIEISENRVPYIILNKEDKPIEFSFMPLTQYGYDAVGKQCDSFSALLDEYYFKRDTIERMRQMSTDINQVVNLAVTRLTKKINSQKMELEKSIDRDKFKICGDLIYANSYIIEKGVSSITVPNFYAQGEEGELATITITLDKRLDASQNAQAYFKRYRKAANAESILIEQIDLGENELKYLHSVQDALSRTFFASEIEQMREELIESGYLRRRGKTGKSGKAQKQPKKSASSPLEFITPRGFEILVGRNNIQNDRLTLKMAAKNDLWFHTKDIPGSHTVLITRGETPEPSDIQVAGIIAAYHSKGAGSSQVPVDYTEIRNVRKPSGAKPGMVIYVGNNTVYVTPDEKTVSGYKKEV